MKMQNGMKTAYAAASLRISSTKQETEGDSHHRQEEQVLSRVKQVSDQLGINIEVKKWFKYSEPASGEYDEQPLLDALEYCKNPKNKIEYFFIRSIDRYTRGGGIIYGQLKGEFAKYGVQLIDAYGVIGTSVINTMDQYGLKFRWSVYSPTFSNELLAAESAKDYVRAQLTNMIGAEAQYVNLGYPMGPTIIGYRSLEIDTEHGHRTIWEADPIESLWIIRGFELRIQGNLTDEEIVNELNLLGYRSRRTRVRNPLDRKQIVGYKGQKLLDVKRFRELIKNPIFAGIFTHSWNNKPMKGRFKGLVTIEMFNKANRGKIGIIEEDGNIMIVKGNLPQWQAVKNKDNPLYPYKRQVLCPTCKNPLLGSASKGKSGQYFPAYHCGRKINGKRHNFRVKLQDFNRTIEDFVKKVRFSNEFTERFKEIALEELEKRETQLSSDTILYSEQIVANEMEIQNVKETIKKVSSADVIKMLEDDIEKLRLKNAVLKSNRDVKEDQQVDTQVAINYTHYFMEHLEDLLLNGPNPQKNAAMFGLLFDETPTYQELIDGTPKLACLFKLNEDFNTTKSLDVSRAGFEPATKSLKGSCSTAELPALDRLLVMSSKI